MSKTDQVYLQDVLDSINKIEDFVGDYDYKQFEVDDRTQFAIFHALEIIGEASYKLSKSFLAQNPSFPAREAVEMRNFLIHGYDEVEIGVVWKTIKESLPILKDQVKRCLD